MTVMVRSDGGGMPWAANSEHRRGSVQNVVEITVTALVDGRDLTRSPQDFLFETLSRWCYWENYATDVKM